jgi:hypothetical protein
MSKTQDLLDLLTAREGAWVNRDDLNFVGGEDTRRRMSELREQIAKGGVFRLDERTAKDRRLEFRLVRIAPTGSDEQRVRYQWACNTCDSHPAEYEKTQPSIDPRWRIGHCFVCRNKRATFVRILPRGANRG